MKKMRISKKNRVKILSLMLAVCMVISCLPVNIIAASSEADLTEKTTQNEELINELLEPIIVEEDVSKRGENEKHFLCDDGSYIAITYSDKVHEIVDNEWVDIEYDVEDDGKEISPKDEKIKVKFANNTNSSKLVKIEAEGYKISWTVEADTEDGEGINKVKLSKESKSVLKTTKEINKQNREKIKKESKYGYDEVAEHKNAAKKELKKYDLAKTKDLDKNEAVVFANNNIEAYNRMQIQCAASYAQSMIEYKDAFGEGHTLRYMLTEGSINEEIVLDSYKGFKSYSMVIDTDGLTPVVNEYGKVELTDANGKVIMYIDAPYMYDAADAISENITVTAEQESKKTWRISYTPDQEWLTSEDRVYPVVIDPTVSTRNYPQTSVLDAFVYNGQTDYSDRNLPYLRVGYTTGKIAHISYWGVNQLPSLPNNAYMTGAGLYIRFTNDTEDSENIAIYSTSGTLNTAAMNWASRPSVGSFLDNQASLPSGYWVNFCSASFGEKVRDAYRYGTPIAFALKYADGSSKYQYNEFYSADCADTSYRPYLSVKYTLTFADVAEGDYYIRNLNSGKCLSVRNSGTTAGTTVTQYEFSGSSNQVWTLSKTSGSNGVNNAYHLTPKNATGLCLYYSASTIRAQIHNYPEYDRSKWRFEEISTGVYSISSAIQPWLALDVDNYSTEDGADVYVYAYHGNDNQLWVLEPVITDIPTGTYFVRNEYNNKNLVYNSDNSVSAAEPNMYRQQMWNITNLGNGYYTFEAQNRQNYYLNVLDDVELVGQPLVISSIDVLDANSNKMHLIKNQNGSYKICPQISNYGHPLTASDEDVELYWRDTTLTTQNWVLIPTNPSPATQYIAPGEQLEFFDLSVLSNNEYINIFYSTKVQWKATNEEIQIARIADRRTGKVEGRNYGEVYIEAQYEGFVVLKYKLRVSGIQNGTYYLRNKECKNYLDVDSETTTEVVLNNYVGGQSQKWEFIRYEKDYYIIKSKKSTDSYYLGVNGDSANHGASIVLRSGTITDEMKWKIVPDGKVYKLIPKTGESYGLVLSSDGSSVHQYVYQQGESDWYISTKRIFTLTVNNYFDEGYNVKFRKTDLESTQHLINVMSLVENFYYEKFGLIIESTVQKFTSPLDAAKGTVTSDSLSEKCVYMNSDVLLAALENGYWGDSTTTNIIWTGHEVEAYSQINRSHSYNEEGVIFMLDLSNAIQSDGDVTIHELAHQLGAPDHYHEKVNGKCKNSDVCSECKKENARPQNCVMYKHEQNRSFCDPCKNDIIKHLKGHH